jgi:hypothetical protein
MRITHDTVIYEYEALSQQSVNPSSVKINLKQYCIYKFIHGLTLPQIVQLKYQRDRHNIVTVSHTTHSQDKCRIHYEIFRS